MAKELFRSTKFRAESRERIEECNEIIEQYQAQQLRLTLRQLYYQLVSKNIIPNSERSYQNLSSLVSSGRLAALVDWDAIEDRVRQPRLPNEFKNLSHIVEAAISSYRLPRWRGQKTYAELWVEKDALAGVLAPLAREYHATLMVNRGYSSQSAMYESAKRFLYNRFTSVEGCGCPECYYELQDDGGNDARCNECSWSGEVKNAKSRYKIRRDLKLFYLGDHDPSGEDMVRDIRDRMEMFGVTLEVTKIGLTMAQVRQYNPPPNPAKITDPRAKDYIAKYGNHSWEVDALPPNALRMIIRKAFDDILDVPLMAAIKEREEEDKRALRATAARVVGKEADDFDDDLLLVGEDSDRSAREDDEEEESDE